MRPTRRQLGKLCLASLVAPSAVQFAHAQDFPSKPIRLIVPYGAGGPTDVTARNLGRELSVRLGQPVIIDNKPGGNNIVGAMAAKQAPADGHTLYFGSITSLVLNTLGHKSLPYDPLKDFMAVTLVTRSPLYLLVRPDFPAKTMPEFVNAVKAQPGKFAYASIGPGSTYHVVMEMFKASLGVDMLHVPYGQGGSAALAGMLAGQVQVMMDVGGVSRAMVDEGKLRFLAVSSAQRNPNMPGIPTLVESGLAEFDINLWFGLVTNAGTPPAIVAKLSKEIGEIVRTQQFQTQAAKNGYEAVSTTPAEFAEVMKADLLRWSKFYKVAGILPQ